MKDYLSKSLVATLLLCLAASASSQSVWEQAADKMPKILSGYMQVGYKYEDKNVSAGDEDVSTFQSKRFRLTLNTPVTKMVDVKAQAEFFSSSKDARGKATMSLIDAYANIAPSKEVQFRVGQFCLPNGYENYEVSHTNGETIDYATFCYNILCRNSIQSPNYIDYGRDIGVMMHGDVLPAASGEYDHISYYLSLTNGEYANKSDNNKAKDFTGRVMYRPMKYLDFTAGYQYGKYEGEYQGQPDVDGLDISRYIAGFWYNNPHNFSIRSEYGYLKSSKVDVKEQAFYLLVAYRAGKFQPVARYEFYRNKAQKTSLDNQDYYLVGLTYKPHKNYNFQVNYTINKYTAEAKQAHDHTGVGNLLQAICMIQF